MKRLHLTGNCKKYVKKVKFYRAMQGRLCYNEIKIYITQNTGEEFRL